MGRHYVFMLILEFFDLRLLLGIHLVVVEGLAYSNDVSGYTSGKCYTYWQILSCLPGTHGGTR